MKKYPKEFYVNKKIDCSLYTSRQKEELLNYVQQIGHTVNEKVRNSPFIYFWKDYNCACSSEGTRDYFNANYKTELLPKHLFNDIKNKLK